MSEPDSGSDACSLRIRAVAFDGGCVLNSAKTFVTNFPVAYLAVLFACLENKPRILTSQSLLQLTVVSRLGNKIVTVQVRLPTPRPRRLCRRVCEPLLNWR